MIHPSCCIAVLAITPLMTMTFLFGGASSGCCSAQAFVVKRIMPPIFEDDRPDVSYPLQPSPNTSVRSYRVKRQLPPLEQGNQVIDNIFQIPISTLNAVGSLIKSTRPIVRRTRERIQQYYYSNGQQQQQQQLQQQLQQQYIYNRPKPIQSSSLQSFYLYPYGGGNSNNNRRKQQRDDPLPQGRHHRYSGDDD